MRADRLREYRALGIDTINGSGRPHPQEAFKVAELLFPELGLDRNARVIDVDNPGRVECAPALRLNTCLVVAV